MVRLLWAITRLATLAYKPRITQNPPNAQDALCSPRWSCARSSPLRSTSSERSSDLVPPQQRAGSHHQEWRGLCRKWQVGGAPPLVAAPARSLRPSAWGEIITSNQLPSFHLCIPILVLPSALVSFRALFNAVLSSFASPLGTWDRREIAEIIEAVLIRRSLASGMPSIPSFVVTTVGFSSSRNPGFEMPISGVRGSPWRLCW